MKPITLVALAIGLTAAGCSQSNSTTPITLSPSPALTTETFTGTLAAQGATSHVFTVVVAGTVSITLVSAGPPATITVGLGVGNPSGSSCTVVSAVNATASATAQLTGTASPGAFCISVFDVGNLGGAIDYTVTVSHP
jgi:hypothetical protein